MGCRWHTLSRLIPNLLFDENTPLAYQSLGGEFHRLDWPGSVRGKVRAALEELASNGSRDFVHISRRDDDHLASYLG
jgi:hypothetical protein